MSKTLSEKRSPDQIHLSFKNNEEEKKLYAWLKQKLNPGIFLKEIAYREYLIETGKLQYISTQSLTSNSDTKETELIQHDSEKTTLINNNYEFDDDDE